MLNATRLDTTGLTTPQTKWVGGGYELVNIIDAILVN